MKWVTVSLNESEVEELRLIVDFLADLLEDAEYQLGESRGTEAE